MIIVGLVTFSSTRKWVVDWESARCVHGMTAFYLMENAAAYGSTNLYDRLVMWLDYHYAENGGLSCV